MDWRKYWKDATQNESNKLRQVQRTKQGVELTELDLDTYVEYVSRTIDLKSSKNLLDLCCGNGVMTTKLSQYCKTTVGIDFTKFLISEALENSSHEQVDYYCHNVLNVESLYAGKKQFDKITLLFSLQYFTNRQVEELLDSLKKILSKDGLVFFGDIPDIKYQGVLAGKGFQKLKYKLKYSLGKDETGKFWSQEELDSICVNNGLKGTYLKQPSILPYSDYRFDYIIRF